MPDLENLEQDAEKQVSSHPQQADDAVKDADKAADSHLSGTEKEMADKGADAAEKKFGGDGSPTQ